MELNEKAHERVEGIRRANALKSVQKIKELTLEHQKKKDAAADPNTIMQDEEEVVKKPEESKIKSMNGVKKNGKQRREPLEK